MKKRKIRMLFMMFLCVFCFAAGSVSAEDGWVDENGEWHEYEDEEETEEETEHKPAYFEEIQTNLISGWPEGPAVEAGAAIVIDADSGLVLYGKNIDRQYYPASITKIMTTLLALENGNLEDTVHFSANAVYSIEFGSSHLGLTEGEELTLEQCLYGIMLASANEISNAVAEHIGGSVDGFVEMMNARAEELGCTGTHFVNPHGLFDEEHYVTAHDMALIMQEALKNEKFREIIQTTEYFFPETNLVDEKRYFPNHHYMIAEEEYLYDGCLGGKNGFTDESWNTLVTAAERDGLTVICVILYVPGQTESYVETKMLLDYAFHHFVSEEVPVSSLDGKNLQIEGITNAQELENIRNADFSQEPFAFLEPVKVVHPDTVPVSDLTAEMDFNAGTLRFLYADEELGNARFAYSNQWVKETEAPETETETETETEMEILPTKLESALAKAKEISGTIGKGVSSLYSGMDEFINKNTLAAAIAGGILLLLLLPMLILTISRNRRYRRIREQRNREIQIRRQLEAEIERKSALQVEAELRAEELAVRLEEETKRRKRQEKKLRSLQKAAEEQDVKKEEKTVPEQDRYEGEFAAGTETVQTEPEGEEYIEVPLEEDHL